MKKILFILLVISLLTSCDKKSEFFDFEKGFVNNQISLHTIESLENFHTNKAIFLQLSCNTINTISFPNDYNLKIFAKEKNKWVEIKEIKDESLPSDEIVFSPSIDRPFPYVIIALPKFLEKDKKYNIRIVVSGNMLENGTTKNVDAYIDLVIQPQEY